MHRPLRLLLLLLLSMLPLAMAARGYRALRIETTDGGAYAVGLSEELKLTFADGYLVVSDKNAKIMLNLDCVLGWVVLEEGLSDIEGLDAQLDFTVGVNQKTIHVGNVSSTLAISLCDLNGRQQLATSIDTDADLPIDFVSPGYYILAVGNRTMKICVR